MTMSALLRSPRLLSLLVLVLAAGLVAGGARLLAAGLASLRAEAFLSDWARRGAEPDPRAWQVALAAARQAVALYPVANGDYLDRLGRVYSFRHFQHPFAVPHLGADAVGQSRRGALQAYRAAVAARPDWPFTQVRLLHAKLYLLQFDAEFDRTFARAAALGPWRIEVNRELAEIGFAAWPSLTPAQRELTLVHAQRSVAFSDAEARTVLARARAAGLAPALCRALPAALKAQRRLCGNGAAGAA